MPAQIYSPFIDQIGNLETAADKVSQGNKGTAQRQWRAPALWAGNPLNIPGFAVPFTRANINNDYPSFLTSDNGRVADAMAAKLQAEHLSCQERAFRLRHSQPVRCTMHAANRRRGHSLSTSGIFARIADHVVDVIMSRSAGD